MRQDRRGHEGVREAREQLERRISSTMLALLRGPRSERLFPTSEPPPFMGTALRGPRRSTLKVTIHWQSRHRSGLARSLNSLVGA